MRYKVGDEVIAKVRISEVYEKNNYPYEAVNVSHRNKARSIALRESDIIQKPDMTAEEAWEIARKIVLLEDEGGISAKDMVRMFGVKFPRDIVREYSVREVKTRIEAWEAEKDIKVGDVVKDCNGKIGVVISKGISDNVLFNDGSTWNYTDRTLEKTGRHIDIVGLLKQIGGDE